VKKARRMQNFALWDGAAWLIGLSAGGDFSDEVRRGSNFPPRPAGNCCLKNRRLTSSRLLGKLCSDEVVDALMGVPTTSCRRVSQTRFRRGQTRSDEVGVLPRRPPHKTLSLAQFSNRIACARTRIQTTTFRSSTRTRYARVYASATFLTPHAPARARIPRRVPHVAKPYTPHASRARRARIDRKGIRRGKAH
jgi:hypothetical protein